jgi:hypothetical protein
MEQRRVFTVYSTCAEPASGQDQRIPRISSCGLLIVFSDLGDAMAAGQLHEVRAVGARFARFSCVNFQVGHMAKHIVGPV